MDTPAPQPQASQPQVVQCQCSHGRRRGWGIIGGFFRFIGFLVVLAVVFAVGLAIGGFGPAGMWPFGQGISWENSDSTLPRNMMFRAETRGFNIKLSPGAHVFGVVTAISGQKITIADNGGGTQTVSVSAQTSVLDGEKEIPVWSLRVGNSIRVSGATKDSVLSARLIEVIR